MLFCSWNFGRFFAVVFALYGFIPWHRLRRQPPVPCRRSFPLTGDEKPFLYLQF